MHDLKRARITAVVAGCFVVTGTTLAQVTITPRSASPGDSSFAMQMPYVVPNKSETADSAFEKLDMSHRGYITKDEVNVLDGFDKAFAQADKNKDGKLTQDEFSNAWTIYTGNTRG